jgi:hypothetical protein
MWLLDNLWKCSSSFLETFKEIITFFLPSFLPFFLPSFLILFLFSVTLSSIIYPCIHIFNLLILNLVSNFFFALWAYKYLWLIHHICLLWVAMITVAERATHVLSLGAFYLMYRIKLCFHQLLSVKAYLLVILWW